MRPDTDCDHHQGWNPVHRRSNPRSKLLAYLAVVNQLVHTSRTKGGSHDVCNGQASINVGKDVSLSLRCFGALAQKDDLRLLRSTVRAKKSRSCIVSRKEAMQQEDFDIVRRRKSVQGTTKSSFGSSQFVIFSNVFSLPFAARSLRFVIRASHDRVDVQIREKESLTIIAGMPWEAMEARVSIE